MTQEIKKIEVEQTTEIIKPESTFSPNMLVNEKVAVEMGKKLKGMQYMALGIKKALVAGIDYDKIPGCGPKPTLLKPGASKICLLFGLIQQYTILKADVDYNAKFTSYSQKRGQYTVEGIFNYIVEVKLVNNEGVVFATGIGQCTNKEKGKADMNENSIVKMAKKRAQVDAVLSIADMSAVFTQDLEDYRTPTQTTAAQTVSPMEMSDEQLDALLKDI